MINGDPSAPLPGWFGLSDDGVLENPSDPHSDNPYHSDGYETVCHEMLAAINRREPMLLLTGEAGVGKTTVCRAVIEQLDARTIPLLITERPRSLDDLLRTILSEFGVISGFDRAASLPPAPSTAALADALGRFLRSLDQVTAFVVVFIDNAQFLPLDLLREIGSLELPARRLTIALVGHSALVRALQRRDLRDLDRRITSRHELGPLTEGEVSPYIAHRARVAGEGRANLGFGEDACRRIFRSTRGVPRRINQLCDRLLVVGQAASAPRIDAALVESVTGEFQDSQPLEPVLVPAKHPSRAAAAIGFAAVAALAGCVGLLIWLLG